MTAIQNAPPAPSRDQTRIVPFSWSVHPARERPAVAFAAMVVIAAVGLLVARESRPLGGVASALFLLAAVHRFYLPTKYQVDSTGLTVKAPLSTDRMTWPEIRWYRLDQRGLIAMRQIPRGTRAVRVGIRLDFPKNDPQIHNKLRETMLLEGISCVG